MHLPLKKGKERSLCEKRKRIFGRDEEGEEGGGADLEVKVEEKHTEERRVMREVKKGWEQI